MFRAAARTRATRAAARPSPATERRQREHPVVSDPSPTRPAAAPLAVQRGHRLGDYRLPARSAASAAPAERVGRFSAGGQPLPAALREVLGETLGSDLSDVRVHEGSEAEALSASAFTRGSHIHFARGRYRPATRRGRRLLGHELAHVLQQREGRVRASSRAAGLPANEEPALEAEAEDVGRKLADLQRADRDGSRSPGSEPPRRHPEAGLGIGDLSAGAGWTSASRGLGVSGAGTAVQKNGSDSEDEAPKRDTRREKRNKKEKQYQDQEIRLRKGLSVPRSEFHDYKQQQLRQLGGSQGSNPDLEVSKKGIRASSRQPQSRSQLKKTTTQQIASASAPAQLPVAPQPPAPQPSAPQSSAPQPVAPQPSAPQPAASQPPVQQTQRSSNLDLVADLFDIDPKSIQEKPFDPEEDFM